MFLNHFILIGYSARNLSSKLPGKRKNVGGASGPGPEAAFLVPMAGVPTPLSGVHSLTTSSLIYLHFKLLGVSRGRGMWSTQIFQQNPGWGQEPERTEVLFQCQKILHLQRAKPCSPPVPGGSRGQGSLPSGLHLKTQHPWDSRGPHCRFSGWSPGAFSKQGLILS